MDPDSISPKDQRTSRLRTAIEILGPPIVEDDRAEAGLTTLSYWSASHPERHVWIETRLAGALVVDLEDWTYEETWDNSVAHLEASDDLVPLIVRAWISGASVQDCINLGGRRSPDLA